jgi:hypothetical protein
MFYKDDIDARLLDFYLASLFDDLLEETVTMSPEGMQKEKQLVDVTATEEIEL